jgi:hypothetical protein
MLRISTTKTIKHLVQDKLSYYPYDLKIKTKTFQLEQKWYELDFKSPKKLFLNSFHSFPTPISNNFFSFLQLPKQFQHRCLHFSKYLVNSNVYQTKVYKNIQEFSPFQIIHFYQLQNHYYTDKNHQIKKKMIPHFVHAGITLGNGLCISKIGYLGIYITDIKDMIEFYETDETYIKLCSSQFLLKTTDEYFNRNLQIPNTTYDDEEIY